MARRRTTNRQRRADDAIANIEAVTLTLENGEVIELDVAALLDIPSDVEELREAALKAPAALAFIAAQTERWLKKLRIDEQALARIEAQTYLVYRQWYLDKAVTPTEGMVRARVDQDQKVDAARLALADTKEFYGALRGFRDACDHRCSMIRTLISRPEY